jgi:hypothetical protein
MTASRRGHGPNRFTRPATFKPTERLGRKVDDHAHHTGHTAEYRRLAFAMMENPNEWILVQTYPNEMDVNPGNGIEWRVRTARHTIRRLIFTGVTKEGIVSISNPMKDIFENHMIEAELDVMQNGDVQVFARWVEKFAATA